MKKTYGPQDLHVLKGSFEVIRKKPEMFAGDPPWGPNLSTDLMTDLVFLDAMPATVEKIDGWWVVSSAKDWLLQADGSISLEVFSNITQNLAIGRYAIRAETVIAALASAAATLKGKKIDWVAGDAAQSPLPDKVIQKASSAGSGRIVVFTLEDE